MKNFTPREIVSELDKYIVSQDKAKRAVAIALRNRWRRKNVSDDLRDEIAPKNIILIGPTGVGKTEIARRLAKLAQAPFIKVEATKFTEVGYVGKDVESMIRDLTEIAVNMVKMEEKAFVESRAAELAEERILDLLLPSSRTSKTRTQSFPFASLDSLKNVEVDDDDDEDDDVDREEATSAYEKNVNPEEANRTREKFRTMLREGKLDDREVNIEIMDKRSLPVFEIFSSSGQEEMDINIKDMFGNMMPGKTKKRKVKVNEAREVLTQEEAQKLIDMDKVIKDAMDRVQNAGIVFLDEIDKICSRSEGVHQGADVSREGVQRDILPLVEGSTVSTKYGMVKTDHILFIAAGAFHMTKPSDLIPELQGRFPIRVELSSLGKAEFIRILKEPKNSLLKQYRAMMATEDLKLEISEDAVDEIADIATRVNDRAENIGARRLHTVMEHLLDDLSFKAPDMVEKEYKIDSGYVTERLSDIVKDEDLSKYIL